MVQVNVFEQFSTLFKLFKTNQFVIILSLGAFISLFILLLANRFKNKKITKILCILVYLGIFGTLFYFFNNEILKLLDYLVNNIFLFLFFPNLAVYVLVLVIINVIVIKSTFSKKENKFTNIVNIIFFVIFNLIFYLIIDSIIKNNINVYEQLNVYTNKDLLILIELSMKLFIVWLIVLLISKITSNILFYVSLKKLTNKNLVLEEEVNNQELNDIKTIPNFVEIIPDLTIENEKLNQKEFVENTYNIYNDYIDIVPIKKNSLKVELDENTNGYQGVAFSMFDINNNSDTNIDEYIPDYNEENKSFNNELEDNMQILFDNSNNYLKSIVFDIEKLKDNYNDTNQIKKIYENISMNQKDLTLRDYNYLIDMLVNIKK